MSITSSSVLIIPAKPIYALGSLIGGDNGLARIRRSI